ncbi:MAG TPA: TlpA disulfide reductase family protein [Candidatus Angelobacter sp.]
MTSWLYSRVAAILVAVFMCMMLPASVPAEIAARAKRQAAPDFSRNDAKNSVIRLSDYKGKVVLLNFWATWCHGCKLEIPWFMEFQDKHKREGLAVIGVSMDEDGWKSVKPFLEEKKLNYPVVIGDNGLADQYGLGSMPYSVLIDRDGRIADSHSGVVDKEGWEAEIRALLGEKH